MRLYLRLQCFFVFGISLTAGCSDVAEKGTAPLELTIVDCQEKAALEAVELCQGDTGNCTLSDADGQVTLQVPFGEEIFYTLSKDDYLSGVFAEVVTENGLTASQCLQTDGETAPFFEELDSAYPMLGTGSVQILMTEGVAGVTFDLDNATGKGFYEPSPWDPPPYTDPALEATSDTGSGGFVEVTAPNTVQIQLGGTPQDCVPVTGWPGPHNSVRTPVRENHVSIVVVQCPVPQPVVLGGAP